MPHSTAPFSLSLSLNSEFVYKNQVKINKVRLPLPHGWGGRDPKMCRFCMPKGVFVSWRLPPGRHETAACESKDMEMWKECKHKQGCAMLSEGRQAMFLYVRLENGNILLVQFQAVALFFVGSLDGYFVEIEAVKVRQTPAQRAIDARAFLLNTVPAEQIIIAV